MAVLNPRALCHRMRKAMANDCELEGKKAIQEGTTQEQQKIEWSGGYRRVEELRIHWITVLQGLKCKNAAPGCREGK